MNAARAFRRLKEVEEQKLANRLQLLKLELDRSKKKIDETKSRTDSIVSHRQRILDRHERKMAESQRRDEELQMHVDLNSKARERMMTLRRANVLQVQYTKKEEAKMVNEETQRNEALIERQRKLERERAAEVMRLIREQRHAGQEARDSELLRKRQEARREFQRRVEMEAQRSQVSEVKVSEMERMEMELIQQLEAAQEVQRKAYAHLEEALVNSKQTIMEASRSKLQDSVVDSGMPRRSPRAKRKGTPRTARRSKTQQDSTQDLNAPRMLMTAD